MKILIVITFLIIVMIVTATDFSNFRDAEIDRLLKKLNKPAIKSIQSPDGDIVDCIHIKNHPIYDHTLFKNHTIQMRPSSYPKGWKNKKSDPKTQIMVTQLWTINGKCPKNSIPIRRTRREDILKAESIERYGKKYPNNISQYKPTNSTSNAGFVHEYAAIRVSGNSSEKFHGGQAIINVWKPYVKYQSGEFSLAQIWVSAGPSSKVNSIEAGWQVYPKNYGGDNKPRYFIYWTVDGYNKTGCYNLKCSGFVTTNQNFALGMPVRQISKSNRQQWDIPTNIWKDPRTGNWWLRFHDNVIGYWPSMLFNYLQNGATDITWGGEILNNKLNSTSKHTRTEMGSGKFPEKGWKKASYFRNLEILDDKDTIIKPFKPYSTIVTNANCYNIKPDTDPNVWKSFFYFGGPGRNSKCI